MASLFSSTQQKVLGFLFGQPDRRYFSSELITLVGSGSGAVQRELEKLTVSGLVNSEKQGMMRYYQANPHSPIFTELCAIFTKTVGLNRLLIAALESTHADIEMALVFGSIAKGQDTAKSDIDLLVVSDDLSLEKLYACLEGVEETVRRKISPVIYTSAEFRKRREAGNSFIDRVLKGPHDLLIGNVDGTREAR